MYILRRSDDCIVFQSAKWTPQVCRGMACRTRVEKEIWKGKCGQQASGLAGGRWRWKHWTELVGDD